MTCTVRCVNGIDILSHSCGLLFGTGERIKVKALLSQENINSTDIHGRTPLMYAVIGKKTKVSHQNVRKHSTCTYVVHVIMYSDLINHWIMGNCTSLVIAPLCTKLTQLC